jgi:ADP-ribosylglycohydrolase
MKTNISGSVAYCRNNKIGKQVPLMLGAIIGDIVGSTREHHRIKTKDFDLFEPGCDFTDDTVLTIATADAILNNKGYAEVYKDYSLKFPNRGYGGSFYKWMLDLTSGPYNSFGNGSAMRVSPVGWAFNTLEKVLEEAKKSAEVTHNHPEGIKGAQAVAVAVFLARTGSSKDKIKDYLQSTFQYDLNRSVNEIRLRCTGDCSCMKSVPEAIICFLDSESFEDAIRNAISLGGDADTQACIAGSIAEAFYKDIPEDITSKVLAYLNTDFKDLLFDFKKKFIN